MAQVYPVQVAQPFDTATIAHDVNTTGFGRFRPGEDDGVTVTLAGYSAAWLSTTLKLQGSIDNTNWFDIASMSLTASGCVYTYAKLPYYRVVSSAGTASAITYAVY